MCMHVDFNKCGYCTACGVSKRAVLMEANANAAPTANDALEWRVAMEAIKNRSELAAAMHVERVAVQSGDVVVATYPESIKLDMRQEQNIIDLLKETFPDNKCIVVHGGVKLSVMRPEKAKGEIVANAGPYDFMCEKELKAAVDAHNGELAACEAAKQPADKPCSCTIDMLMTSGCKCKGG